jgi:NADPH-dependent 2,4-dienoyl-CoA reductase/sulfur reductase-like enzyme
MSTPDMNTVAIVGTSLAGLRAAETLRQEKFDGRIVMIGAEDRAPYDRPPLSKKVLSGEWDADRVVLRKPDDLAALNLDWKRGAPATALNLDARTITLSSGENVAFDGLIIATGGSVKRLPNQPTWRGVHTLRTLDDSLALREELAEGRRVVVIGAGSPPAAPEAQAVLARTPNRSGWFSSSRKTSNRAIGVRRKVSGLLTSM